MHPPKSNWSSYPVLAPPPHDISRWPVAALSLLSGLLVCAWHFWKLTSWWTVWVLEVDMAGHFQTLVQLRFFPCERKVWLAIVQLWLGDDFWRCFSSKLRADSGTCWGFLPAVAATPNPAGNLTLFWILLASFVLEGTRILIHVPPPQTDKDISFHLSLILWAISIADPFFRRVICAWPQENPWRLGPHSNVPFLWFFMSISWLKQNFPFSFFVADSGEVSRHNDSRQARAITDCDVTRHQKSCVSLDRK